MIPGRRKRITVTADTLERLAFIHKNAVIIMTATEATLTWAGRLFVAPLAAVETEGAASS
jgi:hypothetical protein